MSVNCHKQTTTDVTLWAFLNAKTVTNTYMVAYSILSLGLFLDTIYVKPKKKIYPNLDPQSDS